MPDASAEKSKLTVSSEPSRTITPSQWPSIKLWAAVLELTKVSMVASATRTISFIMIYAHFAIQHADGTVFIQLGRRDLRRAQRQQRSDRADPRDVRCSGSSGFPVAMSERENSQPVSVPTLQ